MIDMSRNSLAKKTAREAREARTATHRAYQREVAAGRKADDEHPKQCGVVFKACMGMTHYEDFVPDVVTAVGPERAKYLKTTFPDNFKGCRLPTPDDRTDEEKQADIEKAEELAKIAAVVAAALKAKNDAGTENKMQTGAGSENKSGGVEGEEDNTSEESGDTDESTRQSDSQS